ncbi:MAG: LolA family protein [Thiohalospira sp.]
MKKTIALIGIFVTTFVFAQKDPDAKIILDNLSEKTKSYQNIQTEFKIDYKNIKDNTQNSSKGKIAIQGEKYRLNFMGAESFFDGQTLWSYLEEVNEVNISEPEPNDNDIFSNPQDIFTIYDKDFKYQLIDQYNKNGVAIAIVDLYPYDIDEDYSRIRLEVNTDKYQLQSVTIFGKDGSHYIIKFFNYKTNIDLDSTYFIFNKSDYPNVEIIDMRW